MAFPVEAEIPSTAELLTSGVGAVCAAVAATAGGVAVAGLSLRSLDPEDFGRLAGLRLRLWVNGELRQDATVADMIVGPAVALTTLARFQPLDPGDLVLTGTPGGTALQAPPAVIEKLGDLLPTPLKWRVFVSLQERKPAYLKAGDQVTGSIATEDGALDLGTQHLVVRDGP